MRVQKFIISLFFLLTLGACAESSIFTPIPLTLSPLVLFNPISLVADPVAQRLYLVNSNNTVLYSDGSFIIMDISSPLNPTPVAVISIPSFAGQILLDAPRGLVYIPNRASDTGDDQTDQVLSINVNEASPGFLTVNFFPSAANPFGGFYDGTSSLYVAATGDALRYNVNDFSGFNSVDLNVTTAQGRELDGDDTRELGLTPSGNFLFVTNRADNMLILSVAEFPAPDPGNTVDLGSEAVDYIVTGTSSTRGITRDSSFIYVVDGTPESLKIMTEAGLATIVGPPQEISTSSLQVAAIPVGSDPGEVVVDEGNRRAYVSNRESDDISVIDLDLQLEIKRISVSQNLPAGVVAGDGPFGMALVNIAGVNYLYVANFDGSTVTVIDADALTVMASFP